MLINQLNQGLISILSSIWDFLSHTSKDSLIVAVILYVLAQLYQRWFLEPYNNYLAVVATIDNKLKYYADCISNSVNKEEYDNYIKSHKKKYRDAQEEFRQLSCSLDVAYRMVSLKYLLKVLRKIPRVHKLSIASSSLIGISSLILSESDARHFNYMNSEKIRKILGIPEFK